MKILLRFLLVVVFSFAAVESWFYLTKPVTLPIKHVKVVGSFTHIERQPLQALLAPYLKMGFLTTDFTLLKQCILGMPWVETIRMERVWPDTLIVYISEQQPIARWQKNALLAVNGQVFRPPLETFPKDLPLLQVKEGDQPVDVLQVYNQMVKVLAPFQEEPVSLDGTEHNVWRVLTKNGTVLLLTKMTVCTELNRFASVYAKVFAQRKQHPVSVDLRYPNGFAVRW